MPSLSFEPANCAACVSTDCLVKCPYMHLDSDTAKAEMARIIKGEDSAALRNCNACYACEEFCPYNNHPFYFFVERREEQGLLTAPRSITNQWIKMCEPKGKSRVGKPAERMVSHCFIGQLRPLTRSVLFEDIAPSYVLGADYFCNVVYTHFSKPSVIRERLPGILDNFAKLGVKELVCMHDECYASYKSLAPAYGMEVPFRPIHYLEYVYERLQQLKDQITPLKLKVAYQRPCSSRLIPETHHFVDEILALIGVERLDREYQGENALCCTGIVRMKRGVETAKDIMDRNIGDMLKVGAQYCVFNCPFCQLAMAEPVAKRGIKPVHIVDLCKMALGEKSAVEV